MNQKQSTPTILIRVIPKLLMTLVFLAGLFVLLDTNAAHAQGGRTWYLDNVRFDSNAYADGSFHYDPTVGPNGTFSDIDVQVYNPDGTVNDYQIVNPFSGGHDRYISLVAASGGDLTGAPYLALTPAMSMTNFGGYIDILPGPQDLSYQGVCSQANCGPASEPYEEVLPGGRIMAGPQLWYVQDVVFDSGATASGTFKYDPGAGRFGIYSDIDVQVNNPDGTVNDYQIVNPFSGGNERYISIVAASGGDLTGAPYLAMTPAISMTHLGGAIDILPGPGDLSYQGVCSQPNCGPASEPYEEILSGRIVSNPGPQTWHLEGIRTDSGATVTGSYKFDPQGGRFGNYTDIDIQMNNVDGTVYDFQIVNPFSGGNERYISIVAAPGGDLTGAPFIAMTPAMSMTNISGPINISPGPQALSYFGFCAQANCGPANGPFQEIVSGRITRRVVPPTIVSSAAASVPENQTSAIDVNATDNLDSEGNGLLFSLSGGVDAALFNIDVNTGVVTFINAPDFEAPADADADNVYNIQVTVTDLGGRTAVQDIAITVTDEAEVPDDTTPPTSNPTFDPPANAAGWHNADVTITWNWTDEEGGSGIDPDNCELTTTLTGEGSLARVGQCADLASNQGLQGSGSVQIDKTAPASTPTFDPPANAAGWHNADVTITWNWTDGENGSGIDPDNCELTVTLSGEGSLARVGQCADVAGNPGLQGSGSVQIDKTAPETTITANPPATSTTGDATFEFGGTDDTSGIASFVCGFDDGVAIGVGPCTTPVDYTGLASGTYTFTVAATDVAGNADATPASYTWTVDVAAPDTTPPTANPTLDPAANDAGWNNSDVTVNWNWADETDGSGVDLDNCQTTTVVAQEGRLNFQVSCFDLAGNGNTVQRIVRVDRIAPETTITANPPAASTTGDATFEFSGSDTSTVSQGASGVAGFECTLNDGTVGVGDSCTSPQEYTGLANGTYTFTVQAIDVAGNRDGTPASYTWTVDATEPDTTAPTANPTFDPAANAANWHNADVTITFNWTDEEGGSGVDPDNCNATTVVSGEGVDVGYGGGCRDFAGNVGETIGFLLIDQTAPDTNITANPSASSTSDAATFEFSGSDALSGVNGFECQLDGGGFSSCNNPQSYAGLGNGSHTFEVRAIDTASLIDETPASYTWTVDAGTLTCEPGTYLANPGDTSCTPADPGFFVPVAGAIEQTPCEAGTFSDTAGAASCTQAAPGFFVPVAGAAEATACALGFFSTTSGATACTPADIGFYVDTQAASSQTQCPAGTTTEASGSTDVSACVPTSTAFATCGGYDVFETADGSYEAPSFDGNLIVGTNGGNWIIGTNGPDLILGLNGPDDIFGKSGNDVICGGRGVDIILGQNGKDIIYGNEQADWLIGGNDNDVLWGGKGADDLAGNRGKDKLYGEGGYDILFGGGGNDELSGGNGRDDLYGNRGNDALNGGNGNDFCKGGPGSDTIEDCEGASAATSNVPDDDTSIVDEDAARQSNDGENGEDAIRKGILDIFMPIVSSN